MENEDILAPEEPTTTPETEYPSWLKELIDRLLQVLTKLLIKLGIKIAL